MTDNNKFIPIFNKQPFIPKTETRIFLGGRPIEQVNQTGKQSFPSQNKQPYQSERANEINPGYGPCLNSSCNCSLDQLESQIQELQRKAESRKNVRIEITLTDIHGNSRHATAYSIDNARQIQRDVHLGRGEWEEIPVGRSNEFVPSFGARMNLESKIDEAIKESRWSSVSRASVIDGGY
ncbi:MAG: hypothetical protein MRECE_5c022 [Mycoplasmataceae bacterium CE_OT135]|nr:MAG: hypothetical protein MRECE_5c022 [Mycoplasmataceae bacterium CE_OT135]